jgi:hypothetical protein
MDPTEGSETSAKLNLKPGENPKENTQHSEYGETLKSRIIVNNSSAASNIIYGASYNSVIVVSKLANTKIVFTTLF